MWVDDAVNCVTLKGKLQGALFYSAVIAQLDDATPKERQDPDYGMMSNRFRFFINYLV